VQAKSKNQKLGLSGSENDTRMKKSSSFLIFPLVVVGFAVSLDLLGRAVGVTSPWFALVAMFDFLGLARFASPFYRLKLPGTLRKLRPWEVSGKHYPVWGVATFGKLLRRSPLRHLNPVVYLSQQPGDLDAVQRHIESSEAAHLWAAVLVTPYMVYACGQGWWSVVAWLAAVQAVVNIYPILHLRLVRGRLQRFQKQKASRHGNNGRGAICGTLP
jgi:hypothetical protein